MTTQRELAKTERELFDGASAEGRGGRSCARFIAAVSGESIYSCQQRQFLWCAGAEADPLWVEIDTHGMTLATAVKLLRTARRAKASVVDAIAKYNASGYEARAPSGRTYRVRAATPQREPDVAPPAPEPDASLPPVDRDRVREVLRSWISVTIPDGDGELEAFTATVWAEISAVLARTEDQLRKRRARAEGVELHGPTRAEMREACALLGLQVPRAGQGIDMAIARRAQRRLLAAAHPDTTRSNDVGAFHAINAAYAIVAAYQDHITNQPLNGKKKTRATDDEPQGSTDDAHHQTP